MPLYLQCLDQVDQDAIGISSKKLAELAKVNDAQVRRDLSYLGTLGTRGVGYDISTLRNQLQLELGLVEGWSAVIVGIGNLGSALAPDNAFAIIQGLETVALRMRQHCANAEYVVDFLKKHKEVTKVIYSTEHEKPIADRDKKVSTKVEMDQ